MTNCDNFYLQVQEWIRTGAVATHVKMDALESTGYLPMGLEWLFEVKPARASVDVHEDDFHASGKNF